MAKLIVDSGATSAKWCFKSNDEPIFYHTEGLNPYYHTSESICKVIKSALIPNLNAQPIQEVHFYGAGCDNPASRKVVHQSLNNFFSEAKIAVRHDLLGSARACFYNQPGIVCILGTGSNSCLYDGSKIAEHIPSLAFILGDEGSAAYFGKKMINNYFRQELPADLRMKLENSCNMDLRHIMQNVYKGEQPSRFVASYAKFMGEHPDHPFIEKMLKEGFTEFINRLVKNYRTANNHKISFVGSVAFAHQDLIKKTLENEGLTPGVFLQNPLKRLINFHSDGLKQ